MLQVLAVKVAVSLEGVVDRDPELEAPKTFGAEAGRKDPDSREAGTHQQEEATRVLACVDAGAEAQTFRLEGVVRAGWEEKKAAEGKGCISIFSPCVLVTSVWGRPGFEGGQSRYARKAVERMPKVGV